MVIYSEQIGSACFWMVIYLVLAGLGCFWMEYDSALLGWVLVKPASKHFWVSLTATCSIPRSLKEVWQRV